LPQDSIMADPPGRRATYEDLLSVPDHLVAEILDGELVTHPRPAAAHANVASNLGGELYGPFRKGRGGPGGWVILDQPELHLHGNVLVPELAGWRRQRMPELPSAAAFELAPDWVCEVLSLSTEAADRVVKVPIYAREGVGHVWLINPGPRILEVWRLDGDSYRAVGAWCDEAIVHAEPFDAVSLELAALWAR
jgi:Uma2 family endonuclease